MTRLITLASILLCLLVNACSESTSSVAGQYVQDINATASAMENQFRELSKNAPADAVKVMEALLKKTINAMKAEHGSEFTLNADGTFVAHAHLPDAAGEVEHADTKGTWQLNGSKLTLTQTHRNGKDNKFEMSGDLKGNEVTLQGGQGDNKLIIVLRKK